MCDIRPVLVEHGLAGAELRVFTPLLHSDTFPYGLQLWGVEVPTSALSDEPLKLCDLWGSFRVLTNHVCKVLL